MPERYSICCSKNELEARLKVELLDNYGPRYNAAPSQLLPVVTNEDPKGFSFFYWGISPKWAKNRKISNKLINADKQQLLEKPSYRRALNARRCLVPADGFYGWKLIGKKSRVPHRFFLNNHEIFCMAGLWEEYQEEDGDIVHTFSVITTAANELVNDISPSMPAILSKENESKWLDNQLSGEELLDLLVPYPAESMGIYTVSPIINSPQSDLPSMVKPVPPADQFGNYTLFN